MSNVSKANSQMATKWADQRREMIERAKKKKEESKYGLALNGEMALASDVTTGYMKRNSHTPMTPMTPLSAMDEPGPRRTYMNERPVTHEEMNHVKDSLRLLKSKMRNGSRQSLGLNESKNSRGGNQYESEDETYKPNKIHSYQNISDNEPSSRRQGGGFGGPPSGAAQGNYRKVFHPGAKRDSEDEIGGRGGGFDNNPFGTKNDDFGGPRRNDRTERNQGNSKQQSSRTRGDPFQQEENKMASMKAAPKPPLANTRKGAPGGGFGGRNDDYNNDPWGQPDEYKPDPPQNKRAPLKQAKSGYEPSNSEYDSKPPARPAPATRNTPKNRNNRDADKPAFIQGKFEEDDDRPAIAAQPVNFNRVQAQGTEYNEYDNEPKYECPEGCGRKFVEAALEKHVNICKKVFQSKRKAFDSKAMRVVDEQQEQAMKKGEVREMREEVTKKKAQNQSNFPANKKAKWKAQSEAFRANMKAARGEQVSVAEQQVLQAAADEGLIRCDCCGRKFNEKAAQRHIAFCQEKSKKDSIKQAPGAKKPMPTSSNNNTYSKSRR